MKMNSLFKCVGLVLMGAVLVQAQTMRVYPKTSSAVNYVVSDIDSIAFNVQRDTMQVYYPKGKPAIKFKVSEMDSVQFSAGLNYGTLVDSRDGQVYKTIVIGTQTWMAQNLNYGAYIGNITTSTIIQNGDQKFCYRNDSLLCKSEGGLYQWHTLMAFQDSCTNANCETQISNIHQGICPLNWHVPSKGEVAVLLNYLVGSVAGSKMKLNNIGNSNWDALIHNNGNSSGFSGLPSGLSDINGVFQNRGSEATFWNKGQFNESQAFAYNLGTSWSTLGGDLLSKMIGASIRCVKD